MAAEHYTLQDHGAFTISGAALTTAVNAIATDNAISGGKLVFLPAGEGQINLLEVGVGN